MKKIFSLFLILCVFFTAYSAAEFTSLIPDGAQEEASPLWSAGTEPDTDGSVYPFTGSAGRACTFMIYMTGTNLEASMMGGAATRDMKEMVGSGYDQDKITVLLLAGGTTKWRNEAIDANDAAVYELVGDTFVKRLSLTTETNMGEAEVLANFLTYGYETYPAENYILDFWDHGGGPLSQVVHDDYHGGDGLYMNELKAALENSPAAKKKLSLLCFHTCLNGSAEIAVLVSPYAEYMMSSEETISTGFDYNYAFLNGLENDTSGLDTARRLIDASYEQKDNGAGYTETVTFAVFDLSKAGELAERITDFYGSLTDYSFAALSRKRNSLYSISKSDETYDLVDLGELMRVCEEWVPAEKAEALSGAIGSLVVYRRNLNTETDFSKDWSCGISVYFPYKNKLLYEEKKELYTGLGFADGYVDFIDDFRTAMNTESKTDWSTSTVSAGSQSDSGGTPITNPLFSKAQRFTFCYRMDLTEEQAADLLSAELLILEQYTAPDGTAAYITVNKAETAVEGTVVQGEFINRGLYAVDPEGNILNTVSLPDGSSIPVPLPWDCSDTSGKLEAVLTSLPDADGNRENVKALLLCTVNADKTLHIDAAYAYDETVRSYAAGIALDLSLFETATVSVNALLPEEGAGPDSWAVADTLSFSWPLAGTSLQVLDDKLDKNTLYASFLLTDVYLNEHTSVICAVVPEEDVTVWETGDDTKLLLPGGKITLFDGGLQVVLSAGNPLEEEIYVFISEVFVNGTPAEGLTAYIEGSGPNDGILSGEQGSTVFVVPAEALSGLDEVTSVTMTMSVRNAATEEEIAEITGGCYLNLSLK